jgi:hypothetical protein
MSSTLAPTTVHQPQPQDLRAEAQRLMLDGMNSRDIAAALHIDIEALRQLVGICVDCET